MDWDGAMGVPITFLDKYNPRPASKILGITKTWFGAATTRCTRKQVQVSASGKRSEVTNYNDWSSIAD